MAKSHFLNENLLGFIYFGGIFLATLGTLFGRDVFPIDREDWDDDYRRPGKTAFKGKIKCIL